MPIRVLGSARALVLAVAVLAAGPGLAQTVPDAAGKRALGPADAAVIERVPTIRPSCFKFAKRFWDGKLVPFVFDIQQVATVWTCRQNFADIERGPTERCDTALK